MAQALAKFADLIESPDPHALRELARKRASENLLSALIAAKLVDENGKVQARSPAHIGGGDN